MKTENDDEEKYSENDDDDEEKYSEDDDDERRVEEMILKMINQSGIEYEKNREQLPRLVKWFKFPKTKMNLKMVIHDTSQIIKRGEIDTAITQTSVLSKDYNNISGQAGGGGATTNIIRIAVVITLTV